MADIEWPAPAAEYVNEGTAARQWMMPNGTYLVEGSAAGGGNGEVVRPVMFVVT